MTDFKVFEIENGYNCIIIEDSRGSTYCKYKGYIRDSVGLGQGDCYEEVLMNIAKSLRKVVEDIERKALNCKDK